MVTLRGVKIDDSDSSEEHSSPDSHDNKMGAVAILTGNNGLEQ
jgi:hypothetical protein